MPVRLTTSEKKIGGRVLVTTLTDAKMVSATEIDTLHGWCWQVEVDLCTIKAEIGMDVMHTQTPAIIDKGIAVYLLGGISMLRLPVRQGRIEPHTIKRQPKNHHLPTAQGDVARAAISHFRNKTCLR